MRSSPFDWLDVYKGKVETIVCIVSNRPNLLKKNLLKQTEELDERVLVFIITEGSCVKDNEPAVIAARQGKAQIMQIDFGSILSDLKERSLGTSWELIFASRLSGKKNLALALAQRLGADIIFLEDDVTPVLGWFHKHKALFTEGYDLITGAFIGQSASYLAIFGMIADAVRLAREKNDSAYWSGEAESNLSNLLMRLPPMLTKLESAILLTGGNMGVSKRLSKMLCFPPTDYRNDDINYWIAASKFGVKCPYNEMLKAPDRYDEIVQKLPFAVHENEPISKSQFRECLIKDIKMQAMGKAVAEYIMQGFDLNWDKILKTAYDVEKSNDKEIQGKIKHLKENLDWINKEHKDEIKDSDNLRELRRICTILPEDYHASEQEIRREVERYDTARKIWGRAIEIIKEI